MSREHDTDPALRAWIRRGAERAPDWAIWSALDEIERMPQRPAWQTRVEGIQRRFGPASRVLGAAALVVLLVVPLALSRLDSVSGPSGDRSYELNDLVGIVVWDETMPPGWTLDNLTTVPDQVLLLPVRTMPEDEFADLPAVAGYRGGRYSEFTGTDAVFMSWAILFDTSRQAEAALDAYAVELGSEAGWGLGSGTPTDLGNAGLAFEGDTFALMGGTSDPVPMQIYLWRTGNLVLATAGWFDYDREELLEVARGMDGRSAIGQK